MIASAAALLRSEGVAGTSFPKVLEHANAPRGSIGYHFPGGKTELLREAVTSAGGEIAGHLRARAASGAGPAELLDGICDYFATWLTRTGYAAGCPVAAVAQEAYADPDLGSAANGAIESWTATFADTLTDRPEHEALAVAQVCIAAVEGAITMARVAGSTEPIEAVRTHLRPLLAHR